MTSGSKLGTHKQNELNHIYPTIPLLLHSY